MDTLQEMDLKLLRPHASFKESYLAGLEELTTDSDRSAWVYMGDSAPRDLPKKDFESYVAALLLRETTRPEGFVCDTVYWAVNDGEVIGRISLRHELNDFLRHAGGHIGYIVRPAYRGKGAATEMLRQILETPQARSIGRLLLTCDVGNTASEKTILKNHGTLESVVDQGGDRPSKKRFWITLS